MTHSFPSQLVNDWLDGSFVLQIASLIIGGIKAVKTRVFNTKSVRKGLKDQYSNYIRIRFVGRISVRLICLLNGDSEQFAYEAFNFFFQRLHFIKVVFLFAVVKGFG